MEAGRELDRLVADKVMGLKREVRIRATTFLATIYSNNPYYADGIREEDVLRADAPHYSTSIEAAWQVVHKLIEQGFAVSVGFDHIRSKYYFHWENERAASGAWHACEEADTAPEAICLAALQASRQEEG